MFQGLDYGLYETLIRPYATRVAHDSPTGASGSEWVPYAPSGIRLDPTRRVAEDLDPVWPHRRYLQAPEWEVLHRVDGVTPVGRMVDDIAAMRPTVGPMEVADALWHLHVEGFILYRMDRA
jgi:hypothetical protein